MQLLLAGLDLGRVENIVDEFQEVLATLLDDVQAPHLARLEVPRTLQKLRIAQNAIQRRAQLVAHARQEHRLGLVGHFGNFLGRDEVPGALIDQQLQSACPGFEASYTQPIKCISNSKERDQQQ